MQETNEFVSSNKNAWDRAAMTYADEIEKDVAFLRSGRVNLFDAEQRVLGSLEGCRLAIHLQCSHGLDGLSLLNLGVQEVVGIDISSVMLQQAERKTELLGASARWVQSEVLAVPEGFNDTADLVYTGKGALPWVNDLNQWAHVVARLLKPDGVLYVYEGHPLNAVWETEASTHVMREDGRGYFGKVPIANEDFPAAAVARYTPEGETPPTAWEWQWTLGDVVTAVAGAGLTIEHLEEHPNHFWDQFPNLSKQEEARLPHTYSLLARKKA